MRIWTTVETRVWDGSGRGGGGGEREERERLRIGKTIGWWDGRFVFPATVIQLGFVRSWVWKVFGFGLI